MANSRIYRNEWRSARTAARAGLKRLQGEEETTKYAKGTKRETNINHFRDFRAFRS